MYHQTKHKERKHFFIHCLQCFTSEKILNKHKDDCIAINGKQSVKTPEKGDDIIKFKSYHRKLEVPFVKYADFEAITKKIEKCNKSVEESFTEAYQRHQDCGYGIR